MYQFLSCENELINVMHSIIDLIFKFIMPYKLYNLNNKKRIIWISMNTVPIEYYGSWIAF